MSNSWVSILVAIAAVGLVAAGAGAILAHRLGLRLPRKPKRVAFMPCPDCGTEMDLEDKSTFTGRDMRTYRCPACGREQIVDNGVALWQALHDAREEDERESAPPADQSGER
jgi:predicted RNA-binding Zn-ribbon protein involved in translation (DUF1610 family)